MKPFENVLREMPDIANEVKPSVSGKLEWVGMNDIEMPVRIEDDQGNLIQSTARVTAYVNLVDPEVRGIHMSRLYLHLDQAFQERPLTPSALRQMLRSFLDSHEGLSDRALVRVDFDYVIRRKALESDNVGWRRYPVSMIGILEGQEFSLEKRKARYDQLETHYGDDLSDGLEWLIRSNPGTQLQPDLSGALKI
jgi:GTP cyclohydrolase I